MALDKIVQFFNWAKGVYEGSKALQAIYTGFRVITAVVGVKGFLQARQMLAKGQDIMANKVAAGGKLPIIYGTRRVGAQIVYMDTANNSSQNLFVVYALSVGEVDEILLRTLEIDGNPLTDPNQFRNGGYLGSDKISSGAGSLCTANQTSGSVNLAGGTFGTNPAAGGYRYVFNAHHGAASQSADPMLRASIGSSWTTSHQLNGVAYIAASFIYDSKGQFSGVPQITVQVRGKKVYDQRKDSTNGGSGSQRIADVSTYEYSDNPAIIFQDFILNDEFGKGLTSSQLNLSTFTTAANKADALVNQPYYNGVAKTFVWSGTSGDNFIVVDPSGSGGLRWWQNKVGEAFYLTTSDSTLVLDGVQITAVERTHYPNQGVRLLIYFNDTLTSTYSNQTDGSALAKVRRFHCNGYVDGNKTVMENAKELLANMRGIFLYIDGKYELSIEDTGSSTFTITDDHIIEDQGIAVDYGNKDKKANKVIIEYFNANKKYELDTATVLHNASPEYYSDDGEILEIKAEFPYVTDPYIAYNMGKAILTRSRNQTTMQFLGTPEMYKLNVGDIVTLTYTPLGFSGKVCRIEALELQSNGLVAVSLIEYFDVYTWEVPPQEDFEELSDIPSAYNVKKPTNITFTDTDASATNRPFLSWDLPTDYPYHQWRVNVVDSSSNQVLNKIVDINNVDLSFIPKANGYVASITALNSLGVESDAETKTFNVGDAPTATDDLQDGSVTNVKIDTLSAAKINTGELNLGQESGMAVRQTKTGYTSTATGFWLGNDGGTPKFNIGTSTNYLKFDGSDLDIAGEISATTGSIGGFTVGETSLTAGTGTSKISLSTADGIHLGANAFADAPFSVNLAGSLTAQSATLSGTIKSNQSFSSGSSTRTVKIDASSNALYTLTAGSATPTEAPFRIKSDGTVEIFKLDLFLSDGVTKIFDADTGFTNNAFSEIAADLGTAISDYTVPLASNTEAQKITLTSTQNITVKAIKSAYMVGWSPNSSSYAKSRIPTNVRMRLMHSTNADLSSANELATLGSSWTAGVDRIDTGTPTTNQYEIEEIVETETGFTFYEWVTLNQSGDAIDDNFDFTISSTASYAGSESGTDHYFFIEIDGTGGSTFGANSTTSTAARSLNISGVSFYISNGDASDTGEGDITAVYAGTNLTGGGTSGAVTLNLASTILGNHTFSNNLIVSGDLTVQGTTTTIDTANLNVEDNNITINYSSGDSSASANGAGITIQDAVSAGNDATLTWNTSNDSFNFSHPVNVTGNIGVTGTVDGRDIATDGSKLDGIESGATTDQTQSEINALGITAIGLSGTPNITVGTINSGALNIPSNGTNDTRIEIGTNTLANHNSYIDLVSDATYTDYGLRFIRYNGGANTASVIAHRGTGNLIVEAVDAGTVILKTNGSAGLTINSSQNATFSGNVDVTGTVDMDGFTSVGNGTITGDLLIQEGSGFPRITLKDTDGTNTQSFINHSGSDLTLTTQNGTANGRLIFARYNGTTTTTSGYFDANGKFFLNNNVDVTGNVTATAFYGDGSNLTGVTSTTINNNADNRIITGSGTANTLNAESGLTYNGSTLSGANIQMTGNINASGVSANNVSGDVLQINSTTVVDNSRNLTNIGTINSGVITADGLTLGSNEYIQMGGAGEFQIFNDGSNTVLRSSDNFLIQRNTSPRTSIKVTDSSGEVQLSYAGSPKLATTATGIDVTGTISSDSIESTGTINIDTADTTLPNTYFSAERFNDANGKLVFGAGELDPAGGTTGETFIGNHNRPVHIGAVYDANQNPTAAVQHLRIDTDGSLRVSLNNTHTKWFDASTRNLTNIGTASFNGDITLGASYKLKYNDQRYFTPENNIDGAEVSANGIFRIKTGTTPVARLLVGANGDISFYEDTGSTAKFFWDASAESLFIGATSASALNSFSDDLIISNTASGTGAGISIVSNATNGYSSIHFGDTDDADIGRIQYNNATNVMTFRTNTSDAMTIDASGLVGIGISSPATDALHVVSSGLSDDDDIIVLGANYGAATTLGSIGTHHADVNNGGLKFSSKSAGTLTEAMRIDASGNLMVGTTDPAPAVSNSEVGVALSGSLGYVAASRSSGAPAFLNRLSSDGNIIDFRKDGSTVGSIGTRSSGLVVGNGDVGLFFDAGVDRIFPESPTGGSGRDAAIDLGTSAARFKNLYLSGNVQMGGNLDVVGQVSSYDNVGASYGTMNFRALDFVYKNAGGSEKMRIDSLGIDVTGTVTSDGITNAGGFSTITGSTGTSNQASINSGTTTGENLYVANTHKYLNGAGTEQMRITGTSVGIGITDPDQALEIGAGGKLKLSRADNARSLLLFNDNDFGTIETSNDPIKIASQVYTRFDVSGTERMRIDSSGRVGIGTSNPTRQLMVQDSSANCFVSVVTGTGNVAGLMLGDTDDETQGRVNYDNSTSSMAFYTADTEKVRIDQNGSVGIGTSSPASPLHVNVGTNQNLEVDSNSSELRLSAVNDARSTNPAIRFQAESYKFYGAGGVGPRATIDSSGNLLVGQTTASSGTVGASLRADGRNFFCADGNYVAHFNRNTSDGAIAHFAKDDLIVGSIGTANGDLNINGGSGHSGIRFQASSLLPRLNGSDTNGTIDLGYDDGSAIHRFRNLYLSGTANVGSTTSLYESAGGDAFFKNTNSGADLFLDSARRIRFIANGSERMRIDASGNIKHGASQTTIIDSSRNLTNIGTISSGAITSSGNVTAYSDERLKENIETLDSKKALQMRGVSFIKDGVKGSGVIAQEIEKIAPELVLTADDEMGTKSVAYGNLVGYLIETVKELKSEIDELKQRLDNDS